MRPQRAGSLRRFVENTPGVRGLYWRTLAPLVERIERRRWARMSTREVFKDIYRRNRWANTESWSGMGSTLSETEGLIEQLPGLFGRCGVKSILDIPCGDFNWMRYVDLSGVQYTGGDIVDDLVNANQVRYGSERVRFVVCNLLEDDLPPSDMIIVRDCLVHLSLLDGMKALGNIERSGSRYLLTTTFPGTERNEDIITGEWRRLDLEKSPFDLSRPRECILERGGNEVGAARKTLGLWEITTMRRSPMVGC